MEPRAGAMTRWGPRSRGEGMGWLQRPQEPGGKAGSWGAGWVPPAQGSRVSEVMVSHVCGPTGHRAVPYCVLQEPEDSASGK